MNRNTSFERVNDLEHLSTRIYDSIDGRVKGEARHRSMVRMGVNLVGEELHQGNSLEATGELLISFMVDQLERGGLSIADSAYAPFPEYRALTDSLPRPPQFKTSSLDDIANRYADVTRATLDNEGTLETDGRHAIHLMGLAVPYALRYYPQLRPGVVAVDSLIHDFPEVITGDVPTFGLSHQGYAEKLAREQDGMEQLRQEIGHNHIGIFKAIESYENQDHPEAHFVRRLDKEDPFFTHRLNRGKQLIARYGIKTADEFLEKTIPTTERISQYPGSFPLLADDRLELIRRLARDCDWPVAN